MQKLPVIDVETVIKDIREIKYYQEEELELEAHFKFVVSDTIGIENEGMNEEERQKEIESNKNYSREAGGQIVDIDEKNKNVKLDCGKIIILKYVIEYYFDNKELPVSEVY
jgi:hypothetical protein